MNANTDIAADSGTAQDIRPSVGKAGRPLPIWVAGAGIVVAAALLFSVLDGRRRALQAPATEAMPVETRGGSPPPIYIPPDIDAGPVRLLVTDAPDRNAAPSAVAASPVSPRIVTSAAAPQQQSPYGYAPPPISDAPQPPAPARRDGSPVVVYDRGAPKGEATLADALENGSKAADRPVAGGRVRAGTFANRSMTVVQGTLIPAVLESELDSTRAGLVRAVVSRDVRGFDGSRILIPRGSRLIGEYGADAAPGQKRALINWTRLIRPDGATIAIGSPAADTLGRTGAKAKVDTHFLERFGGAILQSILDIGTNVAAREAGGTTILLPGTINGAASQSVRPQQVTPTLKVKRGTSLSVFVARDLDFTGVESAR